MTGACIASTCGTPAPTSSGGEAGQHRLTLTLALLFQTLQPLVTCRCVRGTSGAWMQAHLAGRQAGGAARQHHHRQAGAGGHSLVQQPVGGDRVRLAAGGLQEQLPGPGVTRQVQHVEALRVFPSAPR